MPVSTKELHYFSLFTKHAAKDISSFSSINYAAEGGVVAPQICRGSNVLPLVWVLRGEFQLRCRPRHLTIVQKYEVITNSPPAVL
ncbi:hypothetical protein TNCV_2692531 [Trichonephila clavipes]|uniref:Uncharacterized protein n=1 Tax=Trichonephila clavipes TaxID=2585209 RepID=A0A8X6VZ38_TRICX|nr:hypothetical protein TNCV_2692531 [Trichonephila clavipes]